MYLTVAEIFKHHNVTVEDVDFSYNQSKTRTCLTL